MHTNIHALVLVLTGPPTSNNRDETDLFICDGVCVGCVYLCACVWGWGGRSLAVDWLPACPSISAPCRTPTHMHTQR